DRPSGTGVSAVDHDVGTGHVARRLAGQVQVQTGEFFGLAQPAHRYLRLPQGVVFRVGLDELGEDIAGTDAVDPDLVRGELDGHGLRQVYDRRLGGAVMAHLLRDVDDVAGHRRGGDDDPAPSLPNHCP